MKKQPNFFLPAIQKKYLKLNARLQRAVHSGRFALYTVEKKQKVMQCLARYEKQLRICGKGIAMGAALLLPSVGILAQPVPEGGEFQVNSWTTDSQLQPSTAMDNEGNFVVAWMSDGQDGSYVGIYAQRYNNMGLSQGAEFKVNSWTTGNQSFPQIAMDSDGDFVIAWVSQSQDGSGQGIYAQRYDNTGATQGVEFKVNSYTTNNQSQPFITMDNDGDFVVTWMSETQDGSGQGIYAQRYDNTGATQGIEFKVNTYTTNNQRLPSVAMDNVGDFVISWASYGQDGGQAGIYSQRYDNTGAIQGVQFKVNTNPAGDHINPFIAMNDDGDFIITWAGNAQNEGSIYAQRYQSTGMAQGTEFKVDTYVNANFFCIKGFPSIAMDNAGDFIITWQDLCQEQSNNYGIYARKYNNTGEALNPEFLVNSYTTDYQYYPSIAMDNDGDFVITWASNGQDGSQDGIYAQRFISSICDTQNWYPDLDLDGFGAGNPVSACTAPSGYVSNNLDCDDNNAAACPAPSVPSTTNITDVSSMANWTGTGCAQRYQFQYKRKVDVIWINLALAANTSNYIIGNLQPGTKYQWRMSSVCDTVSNVVSALTTVQNFTTRYRVYPDTDLDGYGNSAASSTLVTTFPLAGYSLNNSDCNDSNNAIHPGVAEICNNNLDDDCDGLTDGSDPDIVVSTWYQDSDGDGKGNPAVSQVACGQPVGYVANNLDCDDTSAAVCPMPGVPVTSAIIDVSATASWNGTSCAQRYTFQYKKKVDVNWVFVPLSSNMTSFVFQNLLPGTKYQWRVSTVCDTVSNVVSSPISVQNFTTKYRVYPDADGDGYGNLLSAAVFVNSLPAPGYAVNNLDCNDSNGAIFPGGIEICNLADDDCDGLTDEGFPVQTYHQDLDDDGYGNMAVTIQACTVPPGYVSNSTVCNDANTNIRPNAPEICNSGTDDDCDGLADDLDPGITGQTTWYIDSDGDGLGSAATSILTCVPPVGYVGNALDCNDTNSSPFCLAPSNLSVSGITSYSATLSWVNSPCVSNYAVQYRPNATGSWLPTPPFLVNGNSHLFTGLAPNTLYQYRIRALCSAINMNTLFVTGTFTTLPMPLALSGTGTTGTGNADYELYPNPGDGVFNLRMESGGEGIATVLVLDGLGKLVYSTSWSLSKGLNVTQMDLSAMANGVYEVQVRYGEMVKSKKVVMVR